MVWLGLVTAVNVTQKLGLASLPAAIKAIECFDLPLGSSAITDEWSLLVYGVNVMILH